MMDIYTKIINAVQLFHNRKRDMTCFAFFPLANTERWNVAVRVFQQDRLDVREIEFLIYDQALTVISTSVPYVMYIDHVGERFNVKVSCYNDGKWTQKITEGVDDIYEFVWQFLQTRFTAV